MEAKRHWHFVARCFVLPGARKSRNFKLVINLLRANDLGKKAP